MKRFKNIHRERRAFIVCSGPSLNDLDMTKLKGEIVFGLNRGYLKKEIDFTYMVCIDPIIEKQFGHEIVNVDCDAVFSHSLPGTFKFQWIHREGFTGNPSRPIWQGHSTTIPTLNLAYYMGCNPIYIIGMDHYIEYDKAKKVQNEYETVDVDVNHFDPAYIPPGSKFYGQNLEMVARAYKLAVEAFGKDGRELYNASSRTALSEDIMPRVDYDLLFQ